MPLLQAAFKGKVTKDQLLLYFGPNERRVGKQFLGDPSVDEAALKLSQFFILPWLQRFPHWHLGVRLMPPAPPAPGALSTAVAFSDTPVCTPAHSIQEAVLEDFRKPCYQSPPWPVWPHFQVYISDCRRGAQMWSRQIPIQPPLLTVQGYRVEEVIDAVRQVWPSSGPQPWLRARIPTWPCRMRASR